MHTYIVYSAILLVIFITITVLILYLKPVEEDYPYEKVSSLMTDSELTFYTVLKQSIAYDSDLLLFSKVRMADIIQVAKDSQNWRGHFNRIQAKHVDFLICSADTLEPILIIELDDKSHNRPERIARDQFVDAAMDAADLPILHLPVQDYDADELRDIIYTEIGEPAFV